MTTDTPSAPPSDDLVKRQPETVREIGYEEAHEIAKRFIDFFFGNLGEKPRVCIPARPEYDDDICLHSFIAQQRIALTRFCAELAEMEKCKNTYATLAYERQEQLFKLRAELAEAERERDAFFDACSLVEGEKTADGIVSVQSACRAIYETFHDCIQAEAARDRFAAVIDRHVVGMARDSGDAAEAIAHHRAREEKNRE